MSNRDAEVAGGGQEGAGGPSADFTGEPRTQAQPVWVVPVDSARVLSSAPQNPCARTLSPALQNVAMGETGVFQEVIKLK